MLVINDKHHLIRKQLRSKSTSLELNEKYYKYLWSLNKRTNSGIVDSTYPENYIQAIKDAYSKRLKYNLILIDTDNDNIINTLHDNGIQVANWFN